MITLIPYFQLYLILELKMESEERVWENCCQKANWQQSQLPISVWWLSYTRPRPTQSPTDQRATTLTRQPDHCQLTGRVGWVSAEAKSQLISSLAQNQLTGPQSKL